jgi:hypothetical protein
MTSENADLTPEDVHSRLCARFSPPRYPACPPAPWSSTPKKQPSSLSESSHRSSPTEATRKTPVLIYGLILDIAQTISIGLVGGGVG